MISPDDFFFLRNRADRPPQCQPSKVYRVWWDVFQFSQVHVRNKLSLWLEAFWALQCTCAGASIHRSQHETTQAAVVRAAKTAANEIVEHCGPTTSAHGLGRLITGMTKADCETERWNVKRWGSVMIIWWSILRHKLFRGFFWGKAPIFWIF